MNGSELAEELKRPSNFDASSLSFAADLSPLARFAVSGLEHFTGKSSLKKRYKRFMETNQSRNDFWDDVVAALELDLSKLSGLEAQVPDSGPLIVVANHPFGLIDGAAICWLLSRRRDDFKVVLWDVFDQQHHGRDYFLPLDLAEDCRTARRQNLNIRRQCIDYLQAGHSVVLFPSGSAERAPGFFSQPEELPWQPFLSKIFHASDAPVLPIFVHGHNSNLFHIGSNMSEVLRRALFLHEIKRGIGSRVDLTMGDLVQPAQLKLWHNEGRLVESLRELTLNLRNCPSSLVMTSGN
ncbi:MAG: 1-acyl-sn-glycerol-3-phosphate acyltransferase [Gammaproteobacteria bacterium]|nr:1-acyl-sn-glycerol-3-phosphate acyltransferase [Gammaproteobacteria bacterium]